MTRQVQIASRDGGGQERRYHTDEDCPRLAQATNTFPRDEDELEDEFEECSWCKGERSHHDGGCKDAYRALRDAAEGSA